MKRTWLDLPQPIWRGVGGKGRAGIDSVNTGCLQGEKLGDRGESNTFFTVPLLYVPFAFVPCVSINYSKNQLKVSVSSEITLTCSTLGWWSQIHYLQCGSHFGLSDSHIQLPTSQHHGYLIVVSSYIYSLPPFSTVQQSDRSEVQVWSHHSPIPFDY